MREEFRRMMERDPAGKEREPTEEDYKAFEEWAINSFGRPLYQEYMRGGWDKGGDV